jgi:hypothetical protein
MYMDINIDNDTDIHRERARGGGGGRESSQGWVISVPMRCVLVRALCV